MIIQGMASGAGSDDRWTKDRRSDLGLALHDFRLAPNRAASTSSGDDAVRPFPPTRFRGSYIHENIYACTVERETNR